ncbi:MAG: DUF4383 domain-containing protein [Actinomycetota bacterium]|nr:DUF4383 domain-containing protein [Actinomycetota bacterium]
MVWASWVAQVRCVVPVSAEYGSVQWKEMDMVATDPEAKFGIKQHSKPGPKTLDQMYSVILGLVVLVLGIVGFFLTGFENFTEMTDHKLLGLLHMNGFHNLVYISLGLFWMLGAFALTPAANQGVNIAVAGALVLVAVLGIFGYWSLLSIPGGITANTILLLAVAVATLIFGSGLLSRGGR